MPERPDSPVAEAIRRDGGTLSATRGGWRVEYHLGGRDLGDEGLARVAELEGVVELNLRDTKVTDEGLASLKGMPGLRRLHLERTSVGDRGVAHLAGLPDLEYLNLYSTEITDEALAHLDGLRKLRKLFVWETAVTEAGAGRLAEALPDLMIVRGVDLDSEVFPPEKEEVVEAPIELEWLTENLDKVPKSQTGSFLIVNFKNERDRPVKLYWSEYGGGLRLYGEIAPGGSREQNTYTNAFWVVTDADDKRLGYFHVKVLKPSVAVIPKA